MSLGLTGLIASLGIYPVNVGTLSMLVYGLAIECNVCTLSCDRMSMLGHCLVTAILSLKTHLK